MKTKSLLFITMGFQEPAARYRVRQFLPYLKRRGYRVFNLPLFWGPGHPENYGIFKFLCYLQIGLGKLISPLFALFFKVVYLQRGVVKHLSPGVEKIIRLFNKNIIFDFDDAIWLNYRKENNPVAEVIKKAKIVVAGNQFLAEYARKYNQRIEVLPTVVDTDLYKPADFISSGKTVTLGWTGTGGNLKYLKNLKPVFIRLAERYGGKVRLMVVCDKKPDFDLGLKTDYVKWSKQSEIKNLQQFEIGLMPLPDDEWTRGKCAFKAIQYMALGIPSVVSPVGANQEVVNEKTGFFAGLEEEWFDVLSKLIDQPDLRQVYKKTARAEAVKRFSVVSNLEKMISVLEKAAAE